MMQKKNGERPQLDAKGDRGTRPWPGQGALYLAGVLVQLQAQRRHGHAQQRQCGGRARQDGPGRSPTRAEGFSFCTDPGGKGGMHNFFADPGGGGFHFSKKPPQTWKKSCQKQISGTFSTGSLWWCFLPTAWGGGRTMTGDCMVPSKYITLCVL